MTQDRWAAGIARNHASSSSIRATAWVARPPPRRPPAGAASPPTAVRSPGLPRYLPPLQRVTAAVIGDRGAVHSALPGQPAAPPVPTRHTAVRAWSAVLAAAVVVALLGWAVAVEWAPVLRVDRAVSGALYAGDDRSRLLDAALQVATAPGLSVVRGIVFLPVLVWLLLRRAWWTAAWVLTAVALVSPLTTVLKELVGRQRPQ